GPFRARPSRQSLARARPPRKAELYDPENGLMSEDASALSRLVPRIVGRVHEDELEGPHAVHLYDRLALPRRPCEMRHLGREQEVRADGKLARPVLVELLAHREVHPPLYDGHVLVRGVPVRRDLGARGLPDADDEGTGLVGVAGEHGQLRARSPRAEGPPLDLPGRPHY